MKHHFNIVFQAWRALNNIPSWLWKIGLISIVFFQFGTISYPIIAYLLQTAPIYIIRIRGHSGRRQVRLHLEFANGCTVCSQTAYSFRDSLARMITR